MQSNCSPAIFNRGDTFFTKQRGLIYTLSSNWTVGENGSKELIPTLSYLDEPLEHCSVELVLTQFEELDRTAAQINISPWGSTVQADASCQTRSQTSGNVYFDLTTSYGAIGPFYSRIFGPQQLIALDQKRQASLWWGESMLSVYWAAMSTTIGYSWPGPHGTGFSPRKGLAQGFRSQDVNDIRSSNCFRYASNILFDLAEVSGTGYWVNVNVSNVWSPSPLSEVKKNIDAQASNATSTIGNFTANVRNPNITGIPNGTEVMTAIDNLAKTMYSTVLVDLGQLQYPRASNMLLNEETLENFSDNISFAPNWLCNFVPGPATADYASLKSMNAAGQLGTTTSTFATMYTCQVPRRKPAGSLVRSILVADMVFL